LGIARIAKMIPGWTFPLTWAVSVCGDVVGIEQVLIQDVGLDTGDLSIELGVPPDRADNLAVVVISALEGAIVLARIRRDLSPFDTLVGELGPLLDSIAVPPT
jgi:hypothetical protein